MGTASREEIDDIAISEFDRLAGALELRLDQLAAQVLDRVRAKGPEAAVRARGGREEIGRLTRESLRAQLRSFRLGTLPGRCPEVDAAAVAALARVAELDVLLNGYRLCQVTLWEAWFALVEDSTEPVGPERRELLTRGSDFFFRYADLLSDYVTEAYRAGLAGTAATPGARRLRAVTALLDGDRLAAASIDFELERHHLALLAWGEDPAAAARRLAVALGRPLLCVAAPGTEEVCWAWLSGSRPLEGAAERTLADFDPGGARLAVGLEGFGEAGFRSGHRQAQRARRFARERDSSLLLFEDVVVEALASENEDDARAFVAHELRGIDDETAASRRIRETLAAYFAAECNAACAGATLGIHQQTVANRLRSAEQRLGRSSIGVRRVELELALRLRSRLPVV